ncbi:MAG: YdeI/OmpD-associated family protein [Bacteroidota bacterium]|nr:YdeI/OmpD-associated family protein [Bacteroidota bacterium]
MIDFEVPILKFGKMGEKSGWSYFEIPFDIAEQIQLGIKKSYRVKGFLDKLAINQIAILPMGEGNFILPLNASMRRSLKKSVGSTLKVSLEFDSRPLQLNKDFVESLADIPSANDYFYGQPKSVQNYYSKWIDSAKTDETKAKRIALALNSLSKKLSFSEMIRSQREIK